MQQFETEEQQVEAIKRFWQEHGKAIILGAVIGLGGLWGWRYITEQQIAAKEAASVSYADVFDKQDELTAADFLNVATAHPDTGYAALAQLVAAQRAVSAENYDEAITLLKNVRDEVKDSSIAAVASLRLARLYLQQKQPQQALDVLTNMKDDAFVGQVKSIQGDAFVQLSRGEDARQAYVAAVAAMPNNRLVKMKLDNLAVTLSAQKTEG